MKTVLDITTRHYNRIKLPKVKHTNVFTTAALYCYSINNITTSLYRYYYTCSLHSSGILKLVDWIDHLNPYRFSHKFEPLCIVNSSTNALLYYILAERGENGS